MIAQLDAPGEWYLEEAKGDADGSTLYLIPPPGVELNSSTVIESAVKPRVLQLRGASPTEFVHDIAIKRITVAHSAPTFMADYEMPSGGDWAIYRGGAIFLDGTEDITIEDCTVDHPGGNGIFLSNHVWRTQLLSNTVAHAGDSGILLVGSTEFMNGTRNTYRKYTRNPPLACAILQPSPSRGVD